MNSHNKKANVLAYYLPQYHPIEENNKWWGEGFTEWNNVVKAKKLFRRHEQPKIPGELGFYDLRVPEVRERQAELAKLAGIDAFCYWHYYFGNGKRLLELPIEKIYESKTPNFPFCLAWANHSWYDKTWKSDFKNYSKRKLLIKQEHPGDEDADVHFNILLKLFKDDRYYKIKDKNVFVFNEVHNMPNIKRFMKRWRELAEVNQIADFYFIAHTYEKNRLNDLAQLGFDAVNLSLHHEPFSDMNLFHNKIKRFLRSNIFKIPENVRYEKALKKLSSLLFKEERIFPTLIPNWDHTPRSSYYGRILSNCTPHNFGKHIDDVLELIKDKKKENKILFIKSWNEWGEGNYLEPDEKYGREFLNVLKEKIYID